MPEQALYLKWRPTDFDQMVGQEHVMRTLRNSLKTGRIRHAYLFSGPRGTGKTTTARLLAKAVNCQHEDPEQRPCNQCPACLAVNEGRYLDLIEIDAATHTGVDDVRELRDKIAFAPGEGRYKVYIIDEVHRFSGSAFDALLKTLEEPPDHAIFVLATTEIDKVPATIKSRCLQFEFRLYSLHEVTDRLAVMAEEENLNIERTALEAIARQGRGSMRDSISLLDQIVSDPAEVLTLEMVQNILGTASTRAVKDLVEALVDGQIGRGLHIVNAAVDGGGDPRQFGQQVVEHLRAVLLAQTASADLVEASQEEQALYQEQAGRISRSRLVAAIKAFNEAVNSYRGGWQPQLPLELALIESVKAPEKTVSFQTTASPRSESTASGASENGAPIPPEVQPTPPGTPPVIPLSAVREKWDDTLKTLGKLNKTAPAVVQFFQPQRIDGNVIYLSTDTQLYFERLQVPEKIQVLERALHDVHHVPVRVKLILVSGSGSPAGGDSSGSPTPGSGDDDELLNTARELGGVIREDD